MSPSRIRRRLQLAIVEVLLLASAVTMSLIARANHGSGINTGGGGHERLSLPIPLVVLRNPQRNGNTLSTSCCSGDCTLG